MSAPDQLVRESASAGDKPFFTAEVAGAPDKSPSLTIRCPDEADGEPFIMLKAVQVSEAPPPLRGVFATFRSQDGVELVLELGWGTDRTWIIGREEERDEQVKLVRSVLSGETITMTTDGRFQLPAEAAWTFAQPAEVIARFKASCASLIAQ